MKKNILLIILSLPIFLAGCNYKIVKVDDAKDVKIKELQKQVLELQSIKTATSSINTVENSTSTSAQKNSDTTIKNSKTNETTNAAAQNQQMQNQIQEKCTGDANQLLQIKKAVFDSTSDDTVFLIDIHYSKQLSKCFATIGLEMNPAHLLPGYSYRRNVLLYEVLESQLAQSIPYAYDFELRSADESTNKTLYSCNINYPVVIPCKSRIDFDNYINQYLVN